MYLPKQFEETRTEVLHALVRKRPLGTLVVMTSDGLSVDHLPFLIDPSTGPLGVLRGHVARANPIWRATPADTDAVVVFQGPDHYITPSWYATKQETGEVVPTWNYAVVHAYGRPRFTDDQQWLRELLDQLTREHEGARDLPWKMSDAPDAFVSQLLGAIVGVEIPIARLTGKWKLSQNRSDADRAGVMEGLLREGDDGARTLAAFMRLPDPRDR